MNIMRCSTCILWLMIVFSGFALPAFAQIATPEEVSGLVFWVDAEDINGDNTEPLDLAPISTWVDKTGNGNDLELAGGAVTYQATGFDGINPGLRFPLGARMAAPNPFSGNFQNEMTVFFVNANESLTRNFQWQYLAWNTCWGAEQ